MKKLISVLLAAAAVFTMGTAVYAEAEKKDGTGTTITFDSDVALTYIHTFGNADEAGMKLELTEKGAVSGRALKISEDFKGELSSQYGGFYLEAEDFGLESFAGHTMNIFINVNEKAAKNTDQFELFSDGRKWTSAPFLTDSSGSYRKASITVPADIENTKMGISFPMSNGYSGDLGLFDDIIIADNYGKIIANIGDIDTSLYTGPNKVKAVLTTIVFIIVIIAVIGGAVIFVKKAVLKYR